jgi:hypothetical protein
MAPGPAAITGACVPKFKKLKARSLESLPKLRQEGFREFVWGAALLRKHIESPVTKVRLEAVVVAALLQQP